MAQVCARHGFILSLDTHGTRLREYNSLVGSDLVSDSLPIDALLVLLWTNG